MLKWFYWTEQGFNILTSIKCQKIRENAHNKFPEPMWRLWMSRFHTRVFTL